MIVITSGKRYIDIDAYASCIAYANLLKLKGIDAKAISSAKVNESVTPSLLNLNVKLDEYNPTEKDDFIIVDVSNKEFFDEIVNQRKIIEILDHHVGYEMYWKERLKDKAKIEFIGAVATLIVELYKKENLIDNIGKEVAILLMAAILDNTLNFKAKVTTKRDIVAYSELEKIVNIENYSEKYFKECQMEIEKNLEKAIENDTKIEHITSVLPNIFGQLTVWEKDNIFKSKKTIFHTLDSIGDRWMMNIICLKDGKSYIIARDLDVQKNLIRLFGKNFKDDILELDGLWLRKEIIKKAREFTY